MVFSRACLTNTVNGFLVSKETSAASVGEIKTKIWFYQTS